MKSTLLIEGPFESDYSLAIVNRRLARALHRLGVPLQLHQRDNTTPYFPGEEFLREHRDLAGLFVRRLPPSVDVHSRYIYPPHTDGFVGRLRVVHCYGWEESSFPRQYVREFNENLDLITVMSGFVRGVLRDNGVRTPIAVTGLGADHILEEPPLEVPEFDPREFTFLHVSSCFPRKGPDVLVEAFCREFTSRDPVRLVIKTFTNLHNEIEGIVREGCARHPSHAPIDVIWRSLGGREMRWLYQRANCLVSPSRGEGFGLPVAEAMLLACPVIATPYSGQAETCSEQTCWPVEYTLEQAHTHLTEGESCWAEPRLESLSAQMRAVYSAPAAQLREKTEAARELIERRFTWRQVAERHWQACQAAAEQQQKARRTVVCDGGTARRIGFVTSWNTRCGIAEYTRYLVHNLPQGFEPVVFASQGEPVRPDEAYVVRCWEPDNLIDGVESETLVRKITESGVEVISIEFNFGFFTPGRLHQILDSLRRKGIPAAVTMHSTRHEILPKLKGPLSLADLCVCHREEDLSRLRDLGLGQKTVLLRQGVPYAPFDRETVRKEKRRAAGTFLISCFGFFLPAKGILNLLQAFALARSVEPRLHLNLLNALYPLPESEEYARQCMEFIAVRRLHACVSVTTEFLEEASVLRELACSDLIVLPYPDSSESSSAAVRLPIASLAPVLCSDIPIFDEFSDCAHRFPAGDAIALANKILRLAANPDELNQFSGRQLETAEELAWPRIARRFSELLMGCAAGRTANSPVPASAE